jgi:hypothetical protein
MMSTPKKRRFMDVLRRARTPSRAARLPIDDAALWASHDRVKAGVFEAQRSTEQAVAKTAHQRSQLDGCIERVALVSGRLEAAVAQAKKIADVYDRLNVVALNAALEGARAADGHGRPLMLLADEVRTSVGRGIDIARDLERSASELRDEVSGLADRVSRAQEACVDVGKESSGTKASLADTDAALRDLAARIKKATGVAPETAKHVAEAAEHAQKLSSALSLLDSTRGLPEERGKTALLLAPVLAPLVKLLDDLMDDDAMMEASRAPDSDG